MVTLTISGLREDLNNGLTRPQLADKYNLPMTQIAKAIKQAGLSGKRAITKKFELIDDTIKINNSEQQENENINTF